MFLAILSCGFSVVFSGGAEPLSLKTSDRLAFSPDRRRHWGPGALWSGAGAWRGWLGAH